MLTKTQEKLIRSLHTRKGRARAGKCLVEGKKNIDVAGNAVEFTFRPESTKNYDDLITTETPQPIAAVATVPRFEEKDILQKPTIIVLDGVQDPGNVGSILRLCQGFNASLLLIDSVDTTNPKVVRSSSGALFSVPWKEISRDVAVEKLHMFNRPIYLLEKNKNANDVVIDKNVIIIAGSEGSGIQLPIKGTSLSILHDSTLESLNVSHSLAIVLSARYKNLL